MPTSIDFVESFREGTAAVQWIVPPAPKGLDPYAQYWRLLTLQPGAPECIIKEAHRFHIRLVHPDMGGSDDDAKRVNVAMDKLAGRGAAANDYVSRHYDREPWLLLGLAPTADKALADRAAKALAAELAALPRLVSRVEWAGKNFGQPAAPMPQPRRRGPRVAPQPRTKPWVPSVRPAPPVGKPEGLDDRPDFGTIAWGSDAEVVVRLTWPQRAPVNVRADVGPPFLVTTTVSKTQPGRVALKLSVDWESPELLAATSRQQARFDSTLTVRWDAEGVALTRVSATTGLPARVAVVPSELDLGSVHVKDAVAAELTVRSTSNMQIAIESSEWLKCRIRGPVRLEANTPAILSFAVIWPPILGRGAAAIAAKRPVRPTGNIRLKWDGSEIVVPVKMFVEAP